MKGIDKLEDLNLEGKILLKSFLIWLESVDWIYLALNGV
jgi:hypothetical protein